MYTQVLCFGVLPLTTGMTVHSGRFSLCELKYMPPEGILPVGLLPLPILGNQVSFWLLKVVWCT